MRRFGFRVTRRGLAVIALLAAAATGVLLAGCGGDDQSLRTFGAPDARELSLAIELHDGWIGGEDGRGAPGESPVFTIPSHTDLTFHVRNAGTDMHELTLYADEQSANALAQTGPIPPGAEATMQFHFHDAQRALLRDGSQPATVTAQLIVEAP